MERIHIVNVSTPVDGLGKCLMDIGDAQKHSKNPDTMLQYLKGGKYNVGNMKFYKYVINNMATVYKVDSSNGTLRHISIRELCTNIKPELTLLVLLQASCKLIHEHALPKSRPVARRENNTLIISINCDDLPIKFKRQSGEYYIVNADKHSSIKLLIDTTVYDSMVVKSVTSMTHPYRHPMYEDDNNESLDDYVVQQSDDIRPPIVRSIGTVTNAKLDFSSVPRLKGQRLMVRCKMDEEAKTLCMNSIKSIFTRCAHVCNDISMYHSVIANLTRRYKRIYTCDIIRMYDSITYMNARDALVYMFGKAVHMETFSSSINLAGTIDIIDAVMSSICKYLNKKTRVDISVYNTSLITGLCFSPYMAMIYISGILTKNRHLTRNLIISAYVDDIMICHAQDLIDTNAVPNGDNDSNCTTSKYKKKRICKYIMNTLSKVLHPVCVKWGRSLSIDPYSSLHNQSYMQFAGVKIHNNGTVMYLPRNRKPVTYLNKDTILCTARIRLLPEIFKFVLDVSDVPLLTTYAGIVQICNRIHQERINIVDYYAMQHNTARFECKGDTVLRMCSACRFIYWCIISQMGQIISITMRHRYRMWQIDNTSVDKDMYGAMIDPILSIKYNTHIVDTSTSNKYVMKYYNDMEKYGIQHICMSTNQSVDVSDHNKLFSMCNPHAARRHGVQAVCIMDNSIIFNDSTPDYIPRIKFSSTSESCRLMNSLVLDSYINSYCVYKSDITTVGKFVSSLSFNNNIY